jgi:hypothetical protein
MCSSTNFTQHIVTQGILAESPLYVVDVGASGGIEPKWDVFSTSLKGVGFDPLVNECKHLSGIERKCNVKYVPAFIDGPPEFRLPQGMKGIRSAIRFSYELAREMLDLSPKDSYNSFQELVYSEQRFTLDEYPFASSRLDFLKVDTDGHDIHVLHGARKLFENNQFLGVCVESQFHGPVHPCANTFANIDNFLRERGFALFDLKMHRYSRRDLPGRFVSGNLSHTDIGQLHWADAFYFRDLGDSQYAADWNYTFSSIEVIKLICLYEVHGLHDCAVELLQVFREQLKDCIDIDHGLDLLAPPIQGKPARVQDYHDRFQKIIQAVSRLQGRNLNQLSVSQRSDLRQKKNILLFGAGSRLSVHLPLIRSLLNPDAVLVACDNDSKKWGTKIASLPIIAPADIAEFRPDVIIITSIFYHDIAAQLLTTAQSSNLGAELYYC